MRSDSEIQKDVLEEIRKEPSLKGSEIGITVKNGVVRLSGIVDTFSKIFTAEKAARKVTGIKALTQAMEVQIAVRALIKLRYNPINFDWEITSLKSKIINAELLEERDISLQKIVLEEGLVNSAASGKMSKADIIPFLNLDTDTYQDDTLCMSKIG